MANETVISPRKAKRLKMKEIAALINSTQDDLGRPNIRAVVLGDSLVVRNEDEMRKK